MVRHRMGEVNMCSYQPNLRCMQAASKHLIFKQTPAMFKLFYPNSSWARLIV